MEKVMIVVPFMRMLVLFFLLVGSQRLCYRYCKIPNIIAAVALGGAHAFLCLLPALKSLSNVYINYFVLLLIGFVGIGTLDKSYLLFISLSLLMDGFTVKYHIFTSVLMLIVGGIGVSVVLWLHRRGDILPLILQYGNNVVSVNALYDTGNTLIDPMSGKSVLVVSSAVAKELTGLSHEQIRSPIESLSAIPGLRLIPYKSVGNGAGFMLGLFLEDVKLGGRKGGRLIAFAPYGLDETGRYQALAGGYV